MELLQWIQDWYLSNCNGDWEHQFGVEITTLDNPGWHIKIDLQETNVEGLSMPYQMIEKSENDWYCFEVKDQKFIGAGDPQKLLLLLEKFREICSTA